MAQENEYFVFISYQRKCFPIANCWSSSNVVLIRSSFGVPLVLLWLSYRALKWFCCAFEEDSNIMRRYRLLTNLSGTNESRNISCSNLTT